MLSVRHMPVRPSFEVWSLDDNQVRPHSSLNRHPAAVCGYTRVAASGQSTSICVHRSVCQLVCQLALTRIVIRDFVGNCGEPRRNRTFNPQIKSRIKGSK